MDPTPIANQFITSFYQAFDANRASLAALYRPESTLLFEGQVFQGPEAIIAKITGLPFQTVQHAITVNDASVTVDGGLLVMVIGQLKTDNDQPHGFTESFYLKQIGDSLFIMNDIFRLHLHHQ